MRGIKASPLRGSASEALTTARLDLFQIQRSGLTAVDPFLDLSTKIFKPTFSHLIALFHALFIESHHLHHRKIETAPSKCLIVRKDHDNP